MAEEIIGRREELLVLGEFVEAVPACGAALLFEGDAGIGKTALWQEGVRLARAGGFRVLEARAAQSESQIAFATIGDLFAPVLDETLPRLVPVQRHALEIAFLIREPEGPPPEARLLAAALLSIVRLLAEERPLVLSLDDVQWVDASSARILRFVVRRLETERIGVLATVRGRPAKVPLELELAFPELRRLVVAPLPAAAIQRLLRSRLELNLSRPLLVRVHEASGGNAFFALEVGRAITDGTIEANSLHVTLPTSLSGIVARRLNALPAQVRETLAAVAALAAPSLPLLAPLGASAAEDVELARGRGILELERDRIRFTHPLLAPVCYEDMPQERRRLLHRHLAELDVDPEEHARHLALGTAGPDEEIALKLDAAAARAYGHGALQAAAELAELAVTLTPTDALAAVTRRRITAADDWRFAGDTPRATAMLEEAARSSPPGPIRAKALSQLAFAIIVTDGVRSAEIRLAEELYSAALGERGLEPYQKVNILCELAIVTRAKGDNRKSARMAEDGLALAERLDDPNVLVGALTTLVDLTYAFTGRIRTELLDRALAIEESFPAQRYGNGMSPRCTLASLLGECGRYDDARRIWAELIADAEACADMTGVWYRYYLARMEVASGAWKVAAHLCAEGMEVARQMRGETMAALFVMILAELDAYRGDAEKAHRAIPDPPVAAEGSPILRLDRALALLELSSGDARAAWTHLGPLFEDLEELDEPRARLASSVAIELLIGTGDLAAAERLLVLLDDFAASADVPLRPLADRCRGLLWAAQGEHDRAIAALETAAAEPEPPQQVNPFELARTLLALGTVQRQAHHKRAARESLERAADMFERLGARLWLEKTRAELRRIGGRIASEGRLSETERQIVELVVAGRRNREVAAELSLSPNTIAWNLSKVYRKLGVSSRTELAAHVAATPRA
jgi:DNA-binding CsgD family transcriptional regulator